MKATPTTPSTEATIDLMYQQGVDQENVKALCYRGEGWPGRFTITDRSGVDKKLLTYGDSWHFLQKYRPFRCKLCPDGLGELADISCGDAWHRFSEENENPGLSLVLTRTKNGQDVLDRAKKAGYLSLEKSSSKSVIKAQGLVERRKEIFGRQLAMKVLLIPTTKYRGFQLFKAWMKNSFVNKIKSILGTMRRLLKRGLWHKNRL